MDSARARTPQFKCIFGGPKCVPGRKVAPEDNWKNRIDCEVSLTPEKALVAKAVRFFTGSVAHFKPRSQIGRLTRYNVTADGYYNTIDTSRRPDKME